MASPSANFRQLFSSCFYVDVLSRCFTDKKNQLISDIKKNVHTVYTQIFSVNHPTFSYLGWQNKQTEK